MRIYEIGTGYTPIPAKMGAATEIVVEELAKSFIKMGKDVAIIDIATSDRSQTDLPIIEVKLPRIFTKTDVSLGIVHKLKRVLYSIRLTRTLKKQIIKSNSKCIIHFHNQYNMFFFLKLTPRKLRDRCTLAYTNHSYIWHGEWNEIHDVINRRYFQEVYAMKHADYVYALNIMTVNTLVKHICIPERNVILIDNGVNTEVYTPLTDEEKVKIKQEMNLSGKRIFIQVGSVCDRKNQMESVRLLIDILQKDENTVFLYAGGIISDEYKSQLDDYAKEKSISDQVRYLGELEPGEQLNRLYNIAEAMVFPSKSEGFSLVVIEAMAAGTPVIISDSLQFKLSDECLKFSSDEEFKKIVEEQVLEQKKRKEISQRVRKSVVEKYSWDKVASDYYLSWKGKN